MTDGADIADTEEYEDIDANDVAVAAMQGLLASGLGTPEACATTAWMVCVPAFFKGREDYFTKLQPALQRVADQIAAGVNKQFTEPQKE